MTDAIVADKQVSNVVLGESSPGSVLAAIALARRIPGGASLMFAEREGIAAALSTPAHRAREPFYRLHVVGLDLAPAVRAETLAAFREDPKRSLHWYDANVWSPVDAAEIAALTERGTWFNAPRTHHPFPAIAAAAEPLNLDADPFGETLLALAEERLDPAEDAAWGRAWRDLLEAYATQPLSLPASVKPLLHGMPAEMAPLDRAEADALRAEIDGLTQGSAIVQVPIREGGKAALLVLPSSQHQPAVPLALAAMEKTAAEVALVLYDRSHHAVLVGRRRGAEPPTDVRAPFERLLALPFVRRDRLVRGYAQVALADPPKDALERLVAGLL